MQSETQTIVARPNDTATTTYPPVEKRTQIKLTATPTRRALPAVIAASTDEGGDGRIAGESGTWDADSAFPMSEISALAEAIGGDILVSLDRALRFTFANRAAEEFFGHSFDALRGRPVAALAPDAGKGASELVVRLRDALRDGIADRFEMAFVPNGQHYQAFVTPYSDGIFLCLRDTSDQQVKLLELAESHRLVEQMVELAPDMIYIHDLAAGADVFTNGAVAVSLGYTPAEMEAMAPEQLAALAVPEDASCRSESRNRLLSSEVPVEYEFRQRHHDGSTRWFCSRETVFGRGPNGEPRLLLGFARDITDRRRVLDRLLEREEYSRRLTESTPDCILTLDLQGGLIQINERGKALMEIEDFGPLVGAEWTLLFQESYRSLARRALNAAMAGGTERFQGVAKTAVGTPLWWDVVVTPIIGTSGKPTQIVTVARDITGFKTLEGERERLLQDAITRADFDPLTGLLNHRAFHRELLKAVEETGQGPPALCVLLIDLDNFRYFNEAYGRAAGDDLLVRMARELVGCCRPEDTLARIGPDEFGIVAPRMTRAEVGPYVLRLRAAVDCIGLRSPDGADSIPLHLTIGHALLPEDTASASAACDIAEERQRADHTGGHSREAERVRESLREAVDSFGMLDTLIATIDGKDRMTRRQSEDTLIYSRRIAEKFGLTDGEKRSLDIAALLHDVGKVGIDERILRQPGKLSDTDFAVVQQHPKIGAMLVGSAVDDVDTVEAILYHHENWNGTGYPAGLAGEEIPRLARILNVASSYAAMTNNRPYRKGMTPTMAQKVLQGGAGTQWDPECVANLIAVANS